MYILNTLTPMLTLLEAVIIEVFIQCFTESVIMRELGKPASSAEISSPNALYRRAVKRAQRGSSALVSFLIYG